MFWLVQVQVQVHSLVDQTACQPACHHIHSLSPAAGVCTGRGGYKLMNAANGEILQGCTYVGQNCDKAEYLSDAGVKPAPGVLWLNEASIPATMI